MADDKQWEISDNGNDRQFEMMDNREWQSMMDIRQLEMGNSY